MVSNGGALVCYFCQPGIDLLIRLRCVVFESNSVPVILAILVVGHQGWCYERVCVIIMSCVDYKQGFAVVPGRLSGIAFIVNDGDAGLGCFP